MHDDLYKINYRLSRKELILRIGYDAHKKCHNNIMYNSTERFLFCVGFTRYFIDDFTELDEGELFQNMCVLPDYINIDIYDLVKYQKALKYLYNNYPCTPDPKTIGYEVYHLPGNLIC